MSIYPVRPSDAEMIRRFSWPTTDVDVPRYLAEFRGPDATYALAQALCDFPLEPDRDVQAAVARACSGKVSEVIEQVEHIIRDLRFAEADARYARAWLAAVTVRD